MNQSTIIGGLIALIGIALFCICAIAKKDKSCDPERDCMNCAQFDNDAPVSPECCECIKSFPALPRWRAKK